MIRTLAITALLCILSGSAYSQKADFPVDSLERLLLTGINKYRAENGLDSLASHEILSSAAEQHAGYMAKNEKADPAGSGKYKTVGQRVKAFGGTTKAGELVWAQSVEKGKSHFTAQQVSETILNKWKTSKKERTMLLSPDYMYASPAAVTDEKGKKAYINIVFGSYNTFNTGADKRSELSAPYTKKVKKLKAFDAKACKNCDKFKDYNTLQKGVYVKDNKIYLKYDNLKAFKKLMKKSKDGLAIDIVQRAQYQKDSYNIYDNNLVSKGIVLKTVYAPNMYKKNLVQPPKKGKKVTSIEVQLGTLPKTISGDYELNLLVIQDNKVCRTVMRSYIEQADQASSTPLEMMPMPESTDLKPPFEPRAESTILTFTVPFQKSKYDYKAEDIDPFMKALQEPDFIVDGLYIYAYSSIEGDSVANANLQRKRGESIINAFKTMQPKNEINTSVITNDSWGLFILEMEDGQYDYLTKMSKKEAIRTINNKGLANELEPFLSKQRFAQIVMDITYDITGPKEEKFVVFQMNKSVKNNDAKQAYKIEEYIAKNIKGGKYTDELWDKLEIPKDAKNSGILMNRVYHDYVNNNKEVTEEQQAKIKELAALDPGNSVITFNNLFCRVKLDSVVGDKAAIDEFQKKIDALYTANVPKKNVDALNIEYQFKVMDAMDTVESAQAEAIVQACIDKIKSFYNLKDASWQNSLKLAYEFIRFKDYKFAASLLEPYVKQEKVDQQLLFTYISLCAQLPERIKSTMFVTAMQKAKQANPERYCKLFGAPYLTFQVLDNPFVKKDYVEAKCSK
jgi:uncharacterized protein YkwD